MKNVIKNNKLIAIFMGGKYYRHVDMWDVEPFYVESSELNYHLSWDWLIKVVEKIKSIPNKEKYGMLRYQVDVILDIPNAHIVEGYKKMLDSKDKKYFDALYYEDSFIENTYNACIDFINWYNQTIKIKTL